MRFQCALGCGRASGEWFAVNGFLEVLALYDFQLYRLAPYCITNIEVWGFLCVYAMFVFVQLFFEGGERSPALGSSSGGGV